MTTRVIALSYDVYKNMLEVKHDMETKLGKSLSFSKAIKNLIEYWNDGRKK